MLYLLHYFHHDFSAFNLFRYITFRTIYASLSALVLVLLFGPFMIRLLVRFQIGQEVRDDGPQSHLSKKGTPTMGGILILIGILLPVLLWADLSNRFVWMVLVALLGNGAIGFLDDYLKIIRKQSKGLLAWQKFLLQTFLGLMLSIWFMETSPDTRIIIPFFKSINPDLGVFFLPFAIGVISGTSNAVNLTDGLDGLAIGPVIVVSMSFLIISYLTGNQVFAHYLELPGMPGAGEISIVAGAMAGASLGFLWFNAYPASVFMGDVGALALGGALGMMAIITRQELLLLILGGIFVAEALSVIAQVASYKIRKKRVLRMAPLHHHFELGGVSEPKLIVRFWIVALVLALVSLSTLKIR